MPEETDIIDNRIHVRLKRHFVKHGKKIGHHIHRHHKKYLFWSALYGTFHIAVLKIFALKLLTLKLAVGGLTILGINNHSLTDIFVKMDNVCIDNKPIIAGQMCDKRFDTIQDAVKYLESMIDPETDNIYNAQYYGIIQSMLGEYCDTKIDKDQISTETSNLDSIGKLKDVNKKLEMLKETNQKWKEESGKTEFSGEVEFCQQKYLAYDMLDLNQKLFLKQLKASGLLSPKPMSVGQKLKKKSDKMILSSFSQRKETSKEINIKNSLLDLKSTSANEMANIIKNISLNASDNAINALNDMGILTDDEKQEIQDKLELRFVLSCSKNQGYHKVKQYYNDNNVLDKTTLEEIKLDLGLCDSYQYIDQLDQQVKKLLIHEIGHYMYYFKDKSASKFENICRTSKGDTKTNKCDIEEFVSKYSQTSSEEDYADTFSRWALTQINQDKKYLSYYRRSIDVSSIVSSGSKLKGDMIFGGSHGVASYIAVSSDNAISRKFSYFDNLLSKAGGKVVIVK